MKNYSPAKLKLIDVVIFISRTSAICTGFLATVAWQDLILISAKKQLNYGIEL
jgi:hypothetical protein